MLLNGATSSNLSGRPCALTTRPESTLTSNDDFFTCPQASNIPSNLFSISETTAMEPSIVSTEYPRIENIWDTSASTRDNLPSSLSLIEHTDSNSSVGSFGNPPNELLKQYNQELPSIMEDSTSEQCKPKSSRQRRNSMPLGKKGTKRKLSTGSDITSNIAECEQNSSNSSCDMTRSGESSDVLSTQAWSSCYSPYRKRTPSVASSEKGANSLISKLFTEEEKQRFLAAKKSAQNTEKPKKKFKCLGLLGSANKYFSDDVACTSSLNNSIFNDEIVLSKNETPLQIPENSEVLFKSDVGITMKPSNESEINANDGQFIDVIANPVISKKLNFVSELKNSSSGTIADPSNRDKTMLFHSNVQEAATVEVVSDPMPLDSDASTENSMAEKEFGLITEAIENQFVSSVEIEISSSISSEHFSNVEISDSLENMFSAPQMHVNVEEKQSEEVPFLFTPENLLSSVKPLANVSSSDNQETDAILSQTSIEISEPFQQENSEEVKEGLNYSTVDSVCKIPSTSKQLIQGLSLEGVEAELMQYNLENMSSVEYVHANDEVGKNISADCKVDVEEAQSLEKQDNYTSSLPNYKTDISNEDPNITISYGEISENHETQIIETSAMDFEYLEIPETVLEGQRISDNRNAQKIESPNVNMEYFLLHKTLLESHKGDIENTEMVIMADDFCKVGSQNMNLETVQEVPNILGLNATLENHPGFEPQDVETIGFANEGNQDGKQVLDISLEMYNNASGAKSMTDVLTLENSFYPENYTGEDIHLLPNSIPISNGELEMLSFYANLEAKRSTKAKKSVKSNSSLNSSFEECPKPIGNEDTCSLKSNNELESEAAIIQPSIAAVSRKEMLQSSGAKKSFGGSRRVSSDSFNSIRRSSTDSCDRHNRTDSSSSADESDGLPSKRKHISGSEDVNNALDNSDNLTSNNATGERKTALKTFKKPFTVAKKSVDEKTAFKSVIQSYFGVRTALKTCSKTSNSKNRSGMYKFIILNIPDYLSPNFTSLS